MLKNNIIVHMITSVRVKNFKSINDTILTLPQFTAIVGRNAAGKSNLLQSINLIKMLATGVSTSSSLKAISLLPSEILNHNDESRDCLVGMKLMLNDQCFFFEVSIRFLNERESVIVSEKLIINEKETIYSRTPERLKDHKGDDVPLNLAPDKLVLPLYKEERTKPVREFFGKLYFDELDSIDLRDSLAGLNENTLASLIANLRHNDQEGYQQFQKIISKMLPAFSSIVDINIGSADKSNYIILLQEKHLKDTLSMRSISAGDLRTLFIIARAISLSNGSTLIFEEIENALHPRRMKDIIERLEVISAKKDIQVIFTTHSPIIINSMAPDKLVFAIKKDEEGTKFHRLSESGQAKSITKFLESGGDIYEYLDSNEWK